MTISKLCADHLRDTHESEYGQKLKASHSREIVAAFFGYRSHAAQLAESKYPLSEIEGAAILVPDVQQIERRLTRLNGLPSELPSAMELARILSSYLVSERWFGGKVWLYESLENYVMEEFLRNEDSYISDELSGEMANTNAYFEDFPDYEARGVREESDEVIVSVNGSLSGSQDPDRPYSGHQIGFGVTVTLYRVAGRTCFQDPDVEVGGAVDDGFYRFDHELQTVISE